MTTSSTRKWIAILALASVTAFAQEDPWRFGNDGERDAERRRPKVRDRDRPRPGGAERPAKDRPDGGTKHGGPEALMARLVRDPRIAEEFGISEEQISTIQDSLAALRVEMAELHKQLERSAMDQVELMQAEEFDEQALMAAIERTGTIRTEVAKLRVRPLIILRRVLTPEQIGSMTDRVRERRKRWGGDNPPQDARERRERMQRMKQEQARDRADADRAEP